MATRKDDEPVEVKGEEQTQGPQTPEKDQASEQTSADMAAAFEDATREDEEPTRKRRTERTTDHRERAAAKVAGPSLPPRDQAPVKYMRIKLHNNKEIPPGGQHVGINGKSIKIPPNEWVEIPENFVEALDNAVRSEPVRNDNNQVIDYRDVPRFPYTVDRNYKG